MVEEAVRWGQEIHENSTFCEILRKPKTALKSLLKLKREKLSVEPITFFH